MSELICSGTIRGTSGKPYLYICSYIGPFGTFRGGQRRKVDPTHTNQSGAEATAKEVCASSKVLSS